jgi:hypothetical protein
MSKETFLPFFNWLGETTLGRSVADSKYAFAIIEVFHLFGIVLLLGGATLMMLRLVGLTMKKQTKVEVARALGWYIFIGLLTMLVTGVMMMSSIPLKYYHNTPFWWKMVFFWLGVVFHFTLYRRVTRSDKSGLAAGAFAGGAAVVLWYTTAAFGRAIGFF